MNQIQEAVNKMQAVVDAAKREAVKHLSDGHNCAWERCDLCKAVAKYEALKEKAVNNHLI